MELNERFFEVDVDSISMDKRNLRIIENDLLSMAVGGIFWGDKEEACGGGNGCGCGCAGGAGCGCGCGCCGC